MIPTHERDEYRPGGAANTVANLVALGATVVPVGPIEADPNGDELLKLLARTGCDLDTVVRNPATRTVTNTRIVARGTYGGGLGKYFLRVDWLRAGAPDTAAEEVLLRGVEQAAEPPGCRSRTRAASSGPARSFARSLGRRPSS
jgi:bifunctional ADP-heptose synthase (sugar kinase/adenylyltransferase)